MDAGRLRPTISPERGQGGWTIRFGEPDGNCAPHTGCNSDRLGVLLSLSYDLSPETTGSNRRQQVTSPVCQFS
ncbi:MAG: hypothetical protein JWO38_1095 [Gemmataceae bacterium]|nr:hypothetical protein [Gemmataceae bacterium]